MKAPIRFGLEKLIPTLYLVKFPVLVSNETSVLEPTLVPTTPEKLTIGFAVNPTLVVQLSCSRVLLVHIDRLGRQKWSHLGENLT